MKGILIVASGTRRRKRIVRGRRLRRNCALRIAIHHPCAKTRAANANCAQNQKPDQRNGCKKSTFHFYFYSLNSELV